MNCQTIDILMITHQRSEYTRMSLHRLLATCDDVMRVFIWQNGCHRETTRVIRQFANHPRVHKVHFSPENVRLREPTNWFWNHASADLLSKVDDDCLVPLEWAKVLRQAHADVAEFGVIGCWRFTDEDFIPELAHRKIKSFNGHQLLMNCWIEGSGYLMKRRCMEELGPIPDGRSFTYYCLKLAAAGWINGWYYPFLRQEHMDDPRAPHSLIRTDADLHRHLPLTARTFGAQSVAEWINVLQEDARRVQAADLNPARHLGWRRRLTSLRRRLKRSLKMFST